MKREIKNDDKSNKESELILKNLLELNEVLKEKYNFFKCHKHNTRYLNKIENLMIQTDHKICVECKHKEVEQRINVINNNKEISYYCKLCYFNIPIEE
jgi:hypothetical protein